MVQPQQWELAQKTRLVQMLMVKYAGKENDDPVSSEQK